jgi:hypothetical protein
MTRAQYNRALLLWDEKNYSTTTSGLKVPRVQLPGNRISGAGIRRKAPTRCPEAASNKDYQDYQWERTLGMHPFSLHPSR